MKLNLLPSDVSKRGTAAGMWVVSALLAVLSVAAAFLWIKSSQQQLADAKEAVKPVQKAAADAMATAKRAEDQIAMATVINRNQKLAEAMDKHNRAYVDLYREVLRYVPGYFRLTSISAGPTGEGTSSVTLTGQLETFSQYADLAIAMWKVPDVTQVVRAGYGIDEPAVTGLNEADQRGSFVRPGESPLPTDPLERLDAMVAQAGSAPTGYQSVSSFGSATPDMRGPMPGWSTVTMTLQIKREMRTPDPQATLSTGGGAPTGATPGSGGFGQLPASGGGARAGAGAGAGANTGGRE